MVGAGRLFQIERYETFLSIVLWVPWRKNRVHHVEQNSKDNFKDKIILKL